MTRNLDRADIQGNVLLPHGRITFPIGHLLLFHADRAALRDREQSSGDATRQLRRFLMHLLPRTSTGRYFASKRTPADISKAEERPLFVMNVAFSCSGLAAFGVPQTTLAGFPIEFVEGMRARAAVLNDDVAVWDRVWREEDEESSIDLLVTLRVNFRKALRWAYRHQDASAAGEVFQERPAPDYHPVGIFEQARQRARGQLECRSEHLIRLAEGLGLKLLSGHGPVQDPATSERRWQPIESLTRARWEDGPLGQCHDPLLRATDSDCRYGEYEHFGFFDGISDPVFEGQHASPQQQQEELIGQGRLEQGIWHPLATGEFLLGHPDEAQESPAASVPFSFSRNGTFMVVRKLHQDVPAFEREISRQLPAFQSWLGQRPGEGDGDADTAADPEASRLLLRAKLVGRWDDGTPLVEAPTYRQWQEFRATFQRLIAAARPNDKGERDEAALEELTTFRRRFREIRYEPGDREGAQCPFGAHARRSNPRDSGDPRMSELADEQQRRGAGSVLANRRRILRRGMPYGERWCRPQQASDPATACMHDGVERGTLFIALCAGVFRQFEFLQQQWLNYGSEFGGGNDVCPISGVMAPEDRAAGSKLIIATTPESGRPPFVARPAMAVQCRGGAYFFLPSLTALRQIAQGMVDPI